MPEQAVKRLTAGTVQLEMPDKLLSVLEVVFRFRQKQGRVTSHVHGAPQLPVAVLPARISVSSMYTSSEGSTILNRLSD